MKKQINAKEQWFANSEQEANEIVDDAKYEFGEDLIGHSIDLKTSKDVDYYLVRLSIKYNTPSDLI